MNPNSKEFKKLQQLWYKKLEKNGFDDIESKVLSNKTLIPYLRSTPEHEVNRSTNKSKVYLIAQKQDYFRAVGHFLYDHKFTNEVERLIWEYHSDGKSLRETSSLLKNHRIKIAYTQVKEIIQKIRKQMFDYYREAKDE